MIRISLLVVVSLLLCTAARAQTATPAASAEPAPEGPGAIARPTCRDPYDAVESVWAWQFKVDKPNPIYASACFEGVQGMPPELRAELARKVARVYDRGPSLIDMNRLRALGKQYADQADAPAIVVHDDFPDVVLERREGRWLWSRESLARLEHHYAVHLAGIDRLIDRIPAPLERTIGGVALWQYLALLLVLIAGGVLSRVIRYVARSRTRRLRARLGDAWAKAFVEVIASPGATLVVAIILQLTYPLLGLPVTAGTVMHVAVRMLITVSLVWAVYNGVDLLSEQLLVRAARTDSKLDDQLVPLLRKSLKLVVVVAGVLVVLQNLDVDVTTLLAGVSIGGVAIAFAAKDTIANLFGSIAIFLDSPFQIGDWIRVDGIDGTVEEVGFRSTRLRTFYNSVVVLPNAKLVDAMVDNFGRREYRRVYTTLNLTYDTTPEQMQAFVEGCRAILAANPYTRKDMYHVYMSGFGESSLDVMLYFFFKCDGWSEELRERHNVFLEIMRLAESLGVGFAFPTRTLHLETMAPESARQVPAPPELASLRDAVEAYGPDGRLARPSGPEITKSKFMPRIAAPPRLEAYDDEP